MTVRDQRDAEWKALGPRLKPLRLGGKDETLNRMPDNVKVELVNNMARGPAFWSAETTMKRTESYVSTKRHELGKKRGKANLVVRAHALTTIQHHTCLLPALFASKLGTVHINIFNTCVVHTPSERVAGALTPHGTSITLHETP